MRVSLYGPCMAHTCGIAAHRHSGTSSAGEIRCKWLNLSKNGKSCGKFDVLGPAGALGRYDAPYCTQVQIPGTLICRAAAVKVIHSSNVSSRESGTSISTSSGTIIQF
jgi:hypothetical protein